MGGGRADVPENTAVVIDQAVRYDHILEAVPGLERILEVHVDSQGNRDRGANDTVLHRALEQTRHLGLRDVELERDLGLAEAALVVEPRDARHEPKVVDASHRFRSSLLVLTAACGRSRRLARPRARRRPASPGSRPRELSAQASARTGWPDWGAN